MKYKILFTQGKQVSVYTMSSNTLVPGPSHSFRKSPWETTKCMTGLPLEGLPNPITEQEALRLTKEEAEDGK